jgi:DNA polymerase V
MERGKIGERLEKIRELRGLTKSQLSNLLGILPTNYSKYVSGQLQNEKLIVKIISIGINPVWYLTGEGEVEDEKVGLGSDLSQGWKKEMEAKIQYLIEKDKKKQVESVIDLPLFTYSIAAGNPADSTSAIEKYLPFPADMIKHPNETYAVRVSGDSMTGASIEPGDILVVDKAIEPKHQSIIVASVNGEQTVKRLIIDGDSTSLMPANLNYEPTKITPEMDFQSMGVVIWVLRNTE